MQDRHHVETVGTTHRLAPLLSFFQGFNPLSTTGQTIRPVPTIIMGTGLNYYLYISTGLLDIYLCSVIGRDQVTYGAGYPQWDLQR